MVVRKPSITVYTREENSRYLADILAGIEEEGVLYEVIPKGEGDALTLAHTAAEESVLGSGIGICGDRVVMQMRGLKPDSPVFAAVSPDKRACRHLGANSARAIKKMPFRTEEDEL